MIRTMVSALAGLIACKADMHSGLIPPVDQAAPEGLRYQPVFMVGPAPECSNWYAALRKARTWAACDPESNTYLGRTKNTCQERIQGCGRGCDICPILGPGMGPRATFEDLGPLRRDGTEVDGVRGKQGLLGTTSIFNSRLCEDMSWIEVLASTMIHEALHQCREGRGISDFRTNESGCSASALERYCTGISSKGGI